MGYASRQDMSDRYGEEELIQLTNRANTAGPVDETVLARALADADAEIDTYLLGKFPLPLDPVPRVLVRVACDIARFRLFDDKATEEVRARYQDAISLLGKIASGTVALTAPAETVSPVQPRVVDGGVSPAVFSRNTLKGYLS